MPAEKAELQSFIADQASVPLDSTKPLWQLLFVEQFDGGSAIILRVHHSYADGLALISVFHSITDGSPNVAPFAHAAANSDQNGIDANGCVANCASSAAALTPSPTKSRNAS